MKDAKKLLFSNALLSLCERKPLNKITIIDLINFTGTCRQTFYNYFLDINDLICWTYYINILVPWELVTKDYDFYDYCVDYYEKVKQYKSFMSQGCKENGQNCLREYMQSYTENWHYRQYNKYYASNKMSLEIRYAIKYFSYGTTSATIKWIFSGFNITPTKLAEYNCKCFPKILYPYADAWGVEKYLLKYCEKNLPLD